MACRLQFVKGVWQDMLTRGGIEKVLVPQLNILEAKKGFVRAQINVAPHHLNRLGIMHGGVISTLVDIGGSLAVASENRFMTGVTTDLSTTFMSSGGKPGDLVTIECTLDKLGRTMAFTRIDLFKGGRLVARGNHTKYLPSTDQASTDQASK